MELVRLDGGKPKKRLAFLYSLSMPKSYSLGGFGVSDVWNI